MIFEKKGMWKSTHSALKFSTKLEAEKWEASRNGEVKKIVESSLSPLEQLREDCEDCNCEPCECEEEWNSVEETSLETESSMEDHS